MAPIASSYDLFLSYNSADRRIVEEVAHKLADAGLKELFLDRWNLLIGTRWRPMLEKALGSSKAVAIFVGPGEMGSWQQREADVALDLQAKSPDFPVIPVLLPGSEPPLGFLRQLTWMDFRSQLLDRANAVLTEAAQALCERFDEISNGSLRSFMSQASEFRQIRRHMKNWRRSP
jgi:hypothetical protein